MAETELLAAEPADGFDRFYRLLYADDPVRAHGPYDWQTRLAQHLVEDGPPATLEAPTGAGKTTLIEAFLFALAWQLHNGDERALPLRLFWVVDRRSVVDQVHAHAEAVAQAIDRAQGLREIRTALARTQATPFRPESAAEATRFVQCDRWRGATGLRPTTLRPDLPTIVCSTVDQVGSRILFRGYGTGIASRPIDAALVGTDSLIVVDEAHIAEPFVQTLTAVAGHQAAAPVAPRSPLRVMRMSATLDAAPRAERDTGFVLTADELAEPRLAERLDAEKIAGLGRPSGGGGRTGTLVAAARALAEEVDLVGVVANTVDEARRAHAELRREYDAWLLIGPSRPLVRDGLIAGIPARADRTEGLGPRIVVATQTIEVGVDLDFDALVTACAPLDALIQRFGRLDRAGVLGHSKAVIVRSNEDCPVYGDATAATWKLLERWAEGTGTVDMAPRAVQGRVDRLSAEDRAAVMTASPRAPLLASWHLEALSQTSGDPRPSPAIEPFLHGDETRAQADVNVVWRADLREEAPPGDWATRVLARPPHPREAVSVPAWAVRRWLIGEPAPAVTDIESDEREAPPLKPVGDVPKRFVRVTPGARGAGPEAEETRDPIVAPGATVVVPASYGGCDEFGWRPRSAIGASRYRPDDLGDYSVVQPCVLFDTAWALPPRASELLRETARKVHTALERFPDELTERDLYVELRDPVVAWLRDRLDHSDGTGPQAGQTDALADLIDWLVDSDAGAVTIVGVDPLGESEAPPAVVLVPDTRRPVDWQVRRRVPLIDHERGVLHYAGRLATAWSDGSLERRSVELAAEYHDVGKRDPRFQRWLHLGGTPDPDRPLAKSGVGSRSRRSRQARVAAGWPEGKRHESLSCLAIQRSGLASDPDCDGALVAHLVAVHHGRNRPFLAPDAGDPDPVVVRLDIGSGTVEVGSDEEIDWAAHASRFARLNARYSPWGLAALEAALVLADWRASQEEQA